MGGLSSKSATAENDLEDLPNNQGTADYDKYRAFRDELLSFSLGESAFDYAERLFSEHPESPEVMALLAETTVMYDQTKNKVLREHWVDRMDLLQRGIDVSRKCMKENPEYGPCYRSYVLCATRASEAVHFLRFFKGLGLAENYQAIMRRGEESMKLMPQDADVPNMLGAINGRCAFSWYNPYRFITRIYQLPPKKVLQERAIEFHRIAVERAPQKLEYACRLAQAYFQAGDYNNARRWYCKVRDEMPLESLRDEKWQTLAHTQLSTGFMKSKWNVPFA